MTLPITILIPVYCTTPESLDWFNECLTSAIKQGCEVVVWNDGSPQGAGYLLQLCNEVGVRIEGTPINHGPCYARNRAAEMADTELIFPLDCDDVLADEAMQKLYEVWDGTPVFPDLWKFGDVNDKHFRLLDWSCKLQKQKLGIAPVNVLHSKEQWKSLGGWDETYNRHNIYEDSEYNVRLFYTYCAKNLHLPLVGYRQHAGSRIKQHAADSALLARQMLQKIGGYSDMACCGKGRRTPSNAPASQPQSVMVANQQLEIAALPGAAEGMVWVQYTGGKGKMKHYYRGPKTKYPYKVTYMQLLQVDRNDARLKDEPAANSQFVILDDKENDKLKIERTPHRKPTKGRSGV